MRTINIHFGCNNPRDGQFMDRCALFDLDGELSIESNIYKGDDLWGAKIRRADNLVTIHRRSFRVVGWDYWVGNWCWDVARMVPDEAAKLLSYLRALQCSGSPWYGCSEGAEPLFDLWLSGKKITQDSLLDAIQKTFT